MGGGHRLQGVRWNSDCCTYFARICLFTAVEKVVWESPDDIERTQARLPVRDSRAAVLLDCNHGSQRTRRWRSLTRSWPYDAFPAFYSRRRSLVSWLATAHGSGGAWDVHRPVPLRARRTLDRNIESDNRVALGQEVFVISPAQTSDGPSRA